MRRSSGVAVLAAGLLATSFLLSSASADDHDEKEGSDENGTTMELIAKTVDQVDIDLGEDGPSLGDQNVFTDDLYKDGELVGKNHGACTVAQIDGDEASLQCLVTVVIDEKGQMTLQGAVTFTGEDVPDPFEIAITGGTGDFRGAEGEVTVELTSENEATLTVHLDD